MATSATFFVKIHFFPAFFPSLSERKSKKGSHLQMSGEEKWRCTCQHNFLPVSPSLIPYVNMKLAWLTLWIALLILSLASSLPCKTACVYASVLASLAILNVIRRRQKRTQARERERERERRRHPKWQEGKGRNHTQRSYIRVRKECLYSNTKIWAWNNRLTGQVYFTFFGSFLNFQLKLKKIEKERTKP